MLACRRCSPNLMWTASASSQGEVYCTGTYLAKLVHAVEPLACGPRGPRLGAKAVPESSHLDGEVRLIEQLVHVQATKRHLGSAREAQC